MNFDPAKGRQLNLSDGRPAVLLDRFEIDGKDYGLLCMSILPSLGGDKMLVNRIVRVEPGSSSEMLRLVGVESGSEEGQLCQRRVMAELQLVMSAHGLTEGQDYRADLVDNPNHLDTEGA
jgi:hypothetical protein